MKHPISTLIDNLLFTTRGAVWAGWRITPAQYPLSSQEVKQGVLGMHMGLLRALRGEFLLLGLCAETDPTAVVRGMITGIPLEERPGWISECEATLDTLETIQLGARAFWLFVPLANSGRERFAEPLRAAQEKIFDNAGLPRRVPAAQRVETRLAQAERLRSQLPDAFNLRPTTVAEVAWIYEHAARRGLSIDMAVPNADATEEALWRPTSPAALCRPALDEGGQSDRHSKARGAIELLKHRYVKVVDPTLETSSYQATITVADTPSQGIAFPGGEWLGSIDSCGQIVDWALRGVVRSREEVTALNRKAIRNIADQMDQREDETRAGGSSDLDRAAAGLTRYQQILDQNDLEVEVAATTLLTVAAETAEECRAAAVDVMKFLNNTDFKATLEIGAQEEFWWAALPGMPTTRAVRDMQQITTSKDWSMAMPLISSELGDPNGTLRAWLTTGGRLQPVLLDLPGGSKRLNKSMAVGVVGELGGGKSYTMKTLVLDEITRNAARVVALDRDAKGEWETFAGVVPGAEVAHISSEATLSIDPLRVFPPETASRVAHSFLTTLLNLDQTSAIGQALSEVLDPEYLTEHQIASMGGLVEHLKDSHVEDASRLRRSLRVFATQDLGRAVFDDSLPVLRLDAPLIVFRTHLLELPTSDETIHEHLFKQLPLPKIFGRAVHALLTAMTRRIAFADQSEEVLFVVDEAHAVTSSPQGHEEVKLFVREGRKHLAALIIGSHDPSDFGDKVLRGLISVRIVMRQTDRALAEDAVRWLTGATEDEAVDEELVRTVVEDLSPIPPGAEKPPKERMGEGLMRDFAARLGQVKFVEPADPARRAAIDTTPAERERAS